MSHTEGRTKAEIDQEYVNLCMLCGDASYKIWAIKRSSGEAIKQEELKIQEMFDKMYLLNKQAADLRENQTIEAQDASETV